jgi:hypothetical protein
MTRSDPVDPGGNEDDVRWVEAVRRLGVDSPVAVEGAIHLRDFALGTLMKQWRAGILLGSIATKYPFMRLRPPLPGWQTEAIRSLVAYSVCRSIGPFLTAEIMNGGWDSARGTRIRTYFVGRCYYSFGDDYRRMREEERTAFDLLALSPDVDLDVVQCIHQHHGSDPESTAIRSDQIRRLLVDVDETTRCILLLVADGWSLRQIAIKLEMSPAEVTKIWRRFQRLARTLGRDDADG